MSDRSYGLITEGDKDIAAYQELIAKICGSVLCIVSQRAGGREKLFQNLPGFLSKLEHANPVGEAVDKALVIRDADGKDPRSVEEKL